MLQNKATCQEGVTDMIQNLRGAERTHILCHFWVVYIFSNSEEVNSKDFYTATFNGINVPLGKCCGHREIWVVWCGPFVPELVQLQLLERVEGAGEVTT